MFCKDAVACAGPREQSVKYETQGRDVGELENTPNGGFGEVDIVVVSCLGDLGTSWIDLMMASSFSDVMQPLFSSSSCENIWSIS